MTGVVQLDDMGDIMRDDNNSRGISQVFAADTDVVLPLLCCDVRPWGCCV